MRRDRADGFTLVELLVVMAVLALLVSLLLPALYRAKVHARKLACVSMLRSGILGYCVYINDNREYLATIDYYVDASYAWDETVLDRYLVGGATRFFRDGCPGRGPRILPYAADLWSYGVNGSVHTYVMGTPSYYNVSKPTRLSHFRRPHKTHVLADMTGGYKRYPTPTFFDTYLLDRTNRHNHEGIGTAYMDGHADFQRDGDERIWVEMWHYAYNQCRLVGNGCFWHAYDTKVFP